MKIAIISDLHCTNKSDASSITRLHTGISLKPICRNPIESLKYIIQQENLIVDYVLCLGDVTNKSDNLGLNLGASYLDNIKTAMKAKDLFVVTGNHDVNIGIVDPFEHLKQFNFPSNDKTINASYWSNHFCVIEKEGLILFLLNTSFYVKNEDDLKKPPPFNNISIIDNISTQLEPYKDKNKVKIALCHYHPVQHSDFNDKYTSNDLIDGADKILNILKKNGFHLFLHGHKHIARMKYEDNLVVFGSGSFSSLENIQPFDNKNTFHIVDLKLSEHGSCEGKVITWIFNYNEGWNKSQDPKFIFPTYTGFGCSYRNVKELANKIVEYFEKWYNEAPITEILPFQDVSKEFPDIELLTPIQQDDLMSYLEDEYNLIIYPNIKVGANHIIKLKI